jgi:glycosyltransferase involved in cell wall biosynthesis
VRVPIAAVLPFRNAALTLRRAALSVLAEPCVSNLVAIDDGSTDRSVEAVQDLVGPRFRIVASRARGLVAALATGIDATDAPFIARMDADDESLGDRIDACASALERDRALAVVACRVEAPGAGPGLARYVEWQNSITTPSEHRAARFIESPLCHPASVLRRSALAAIGGYRECGWAEDYDLWMRLAAAGHDFSKVPRTLFRWHHHDHRLTFSDPRYSIDSLRAGRAFYLAEHLRRVDRELAIWGAGPTGRRLARALEGRGVRAKRFVDIDPRKLGRIARGAPIVPPAALDRSRDFVVTAVGSLGARDLIRGALDAGGFVEGDDYLCAA